MRRLNPSGPAQAIARVTRRERAHMTAILPGIRETRCPTCDAVVFVGQLANHLRERCRQP